MTQLQQLFPDPEVSDAGFMLSSPAGFERVWRQGGRENGPFLLLLLQHSPPSSAYPPVSTDYVRFTLMGEDATSSRMTFVDIPSNLFEEARALSGVNVAKANENVFEIRRLTGLGWGQLAAIFGVDRRTVHNWVKGFDVRHRNRKRIADTLTVLRRIDRGSTQENLVLLQEPALDGATVLELFKQKKYDEILRVAGSVGVIRSVLTRAETTGEYKSITIHPDADGSETFGNLPFEPQAPARDRVRHHA